MPAEWKAALEVWLKLYGAATDVPGTILKLCPPQKRNTFEVGWIVGTNTSGLV